jgi:hypothetical protein
MSSGQTDRRLVQVVGVKVGFPLLLGLITFLAAHYGAMSAWGSVGLAALVAFGAGFLLLLVETQLRVSAVGERMATDYARIGRLAGLAGMMERSILGPARLTEFMETAGQVGGQVDPLLQRLACREVERVTSFLRQLPVGNQILYDGEDRDWMLGLTHEAKTSIDAISLSTVDAGVRGLDGGLWTSDLGLRYLELQRQAINRGVRIRRIFVFNNTEMASDPSVYRVTEDQRDIGVEVLILDHKLITGWTKSIIRDFIIFDGAVSYETTPDSLYNSEQEQPGRLRTQLVPGEDRVRVLQDWFDLLWMQKSREP